MTKFMFAVENVLETIRIGYKAVLNHSSDHLKNSAILYQAIEKPGKKFSANNKQKSRKR